MLALYGKLLPYVRKLLDFFARYFSGVEALLQPRRGLLARWQKADLGENRIWFHVSSVGELEQVRPVMENLKGFSIVLSYFSSSVPRLVKDWSFVRHADYLPLDYPEEMETLMELVRPRLLVLNRYDLWPHHLQAARRRGIPVVVVNASIPPLGGLGALSLWVRKALFLAVDAWTFVDAAAATAWEPFVYDRVKGLVAGDPRVDRALGRVDHAWKAGKAKERLNLWQKRDFCLVAGSTWPEDETVLLRAWSKLNTSRSLVLVPHEPEEAHIRKVEKALSALKLTHGRFSALQKKENWDVLIVDQRGLLAELYGLGQAAYVGGGFRRQIHSIIEPVAHGIPVAFGPHFHRSPEAVTLRAAGSACSLPAWRAVPLLTAWLKQMARPGESRARAEEPIKVFLQMHRGAGEKVAGFLRECLELKGKER